MNERWVIGEEQTCFSIGLVYIVEDYDDQKK